jgi:hypothetical protein
MARDRAHPTGQLDLRGVRFATCQETDEGRRLDVAAVKRLTGGDTIRARKMRHDFIEFTPSHLPFLITNHLPKLPADDPRSGPGCSSSRSTSGSSAGRTGPWRIGSVRSFQLCWRGR